MKSREMAIEVLKDFAQKKKDKADLGKLFVANSVTLATRVRSDVLRAIALKCANHLEEMYVIGFTSRPVLQVKGKDNTGQFALTFLNAIGKFGQGSAGQICRWPTSG